MKVWRVMLKAGVLFSLLNLIFVTTDPIDALGRASLYNGVWTGRHRLPFGDRPGGYNLSLNTLSAMFAAHEVSAVRDDDRCRVFVIGDSSVWGVLLRPDETLAAQISDDELWAFNLGYPTLSLTKDLLLLDYALRYEPDAIIWLVTLESFARDTQTASFILRANGDAVRDLSAQYGLSLDETALEGRTLYDRTIVGSRRDLNDLLRLQLLGAMWTITGIDQPYPTNYERPQNDFGSDVSWRGLGAPLTEDDVAFDVLRAGIAASNVPVLIVNEPIFIANGENSDLHYNALYPRWAYDDYRALLANSGLPVLDLWDAVEADNFTDSSIHVNNDGITFITTALKRRRAEYC